MDILKVISRLLDYPSEELAEHKGDLALIISQAKELSPDHRAGLLDTLQAIYDGDLLDGQERYTGLFEQGRSLSLHVFEHVHGESRDRGQAMVDLMEQYSNHGFEIDTRELPDYLPLFLEYLAYRPDIEARQWLADVSHILAVLGARLLERESPYANLFEALLLIAGCSEQLKEKQRELVGEEPDNTPQALDKEWEEVAVSFSAGDQSCQSNPTVRHRHTGDVQQPQPLRWTDSPSRAAHQPGGQSL